MATTTLRSISRSRDLGKLHSLISDLAGQRCWKVEFAFGAELMLHFGRRLRIRHSKLSGETEGEWILGTCGTAWNLFTPDGIVRSSAEVTKDVEQSVKAIENTKVVEIDVGIPGNILTLTFSNGCLFRILPTLSKTEESDDVPSWELFMPGNMFVAFGPGTRWSLKRADIQES